EYEGPLPAVTVGALVEEQGTVEDTAPFFEGSWSARSYFGRKSVPVLHSTVTVDTPSSHPLHFVARLLPDVKVTKSEANGTVTTVFDQGRLELTDLQDLLPPEAARSPYLGMTTANSWQELAQRYARRAEPQVRPQGVKSR